MNQLVSIGELEAFTGFGPRTTRRLVRERKLPGFMDRNRYVCTRGEYDHWKRTGEVIQEVRSTAPRTSSRKPISISRIDRRAA